MRLVIGAVAGIGCYWGATGLKHMMGYDDSLDAFGVHGVGGIVGAVLTGVFATAAVSGDAAKAGLVDGNAGQIVTQLYGVGVTVLYCAVASFVIPRNDIGGPPGPLTAHREQRTARKTRRLRSRSEPAATRVSASSLNER